MKTFKLKTNECKSLKFVLKSLSLIICVNRDDVLDSLLRNSTIPAFLNVVVSFLTGCKKQ